MPRSGWRKPESDRRLSDLVSVGVLTRVFPPDLVDEVIAGTGRTEQRHRALPARVMAYFAIGMALSAEGSYEDVLSQLTDGLAWSSGWEESYRLPSKSAIFQARQRLGSEPMAALFARVARPIGTDATAGAWLAGRRMVAVDGTCLDVADTVENAEFFGRPGVSKGERAAFPQTRMVALAECGTHAVFAAEIGKYSQSEATLTGPLLDQLEPGMLLMADRGYFSYALWRTAIATGADLLWRVSPDRSGPKPAHAGDLPDGSWLAHLRRSTPASARNEEPMLVRVVDYAIDDGRENPTTYRLLTTLLDPAEATATDLAAAYAQRWEIESTFDELKTHQRGPRTVLRSKSPDLVLQEIWGHLCCHYAIRPRPRPRQLRRRAADHQADPRPPGRFSPQTPTTATAPAGCSSSNASSDASTPPDGNAPHHESSSARCPNGTSSALTTPPGPNPSTRPNTTFTPLTERYCT